jgi:ATP/maltotriose-dependent transcriptional regulator MalT
MGGSLGMLGRTLNLRAGLALFQPQPDPAAALAHATRAVELLERVGNDLASAAEDTRGLAFWALGRRDEAAASFERAIAIGVNSPVYGGESGAHLALVRLEQGRADAARAVTLDVLALAHAHAIGIVRTSAVLAASAVLAQAEPRSAEARAWLVRLLADADLAVEIRQRAQALHDRLVAAGAPAAAAIDGSDGDWLRAIDARVRALGARRD